MANKYYFYNHKKERIAQVTNHLDGTFDIKGVPGTILGHITKDDINSDELQHFKESHNLMHEEELGQVTFDEIFRW